MGAKNSVISDSRPYGGRLVTSLLAKEGNRAVENRRRRDAYLEQNHESTNAHNWIWGCANHHLKIWNISKKE